MGLLIFDGFETTAAPPAAVPFLDPFADLMATVDRTVLELLGGTPVIYQPAVGVAVQVRGVFDTVYVLAKGDVPAGVEALALAVFLILADLPIHPDDDDPILTINGISYLVTQRIPAGMGAILLALRTVQ